MAIEFIARVKAACNCPSTALPFACRCNVVMSLGQPMLDVDCHHAGLIDLSLLTLLSQEERQCVKSL